jgi:hypothetical protein
MWLLLNLRGKWRRKFAARQRRSYLPSLMHTWEDVPKRRLLTICVEGSSWPSWTIARCRLIGFWLALHVLIDDDAPLAIHHCKNRIEMIVRKLGDLAELIGRIHQYLQRS